MMEVKTADWCKLLVVLCGSGLVLCFNRCGEESIAGPLCYRLFPSRLLNPQDVKLSESVPNSSCFFTLSGGKLTLTGRNAKATLTSSHCDYVVINSTSNGFGPPTSDVTSLSVESTEMVSLEKGSFSTWSNILILQINMNYRLERIQPGAFQGLKNVWNLTISDNPKLCHFKHDTFSGLINLMELRFLRNNLTRLSGITLALSPSILPNMTVLYLTGNVIRRIEENDFLPMMNSSLYRLSISLTKTDWIHERALDPFRPVLYELLLTRNNLESSVLTPLIQHFVRNCPKLQVLQLDQNALNSGLEKMLHAVAQNSSRIINLSLRNNHIGSIRPGFFPPMPNLKELDLTSVMIDDIPPGTLDAMHHLEKLNLGQNIFSGLKMSMVRETVTFLDISYNENDLPWNTIFQIDHFVLAKMPNLTLLNLSGNKLGLIRKRTFSSALALKVLYLKNSFVNEIERGSFRNNANLFYLDLSNNNFPIVNPFKKEIFEGLDNLTALDLSECRISFIKYSDVFFHLKNLQYLSLRANSIYQFNPLTFQHAPNLFSLDLRNNILVSWESRIFENNKLLKWISLDFNHIRSLTESMLLDFASSHVVDLYSNPITCDCKLLDSVSKLISSGQIKHVDDLPFGDELNTCSNLPKETLLTYLNLVDSARCVNSHWITVLVITLVSLLSTSALSFVIYYYYKYDIHFWFLRVKRRIGLLNYIGAKKKQKLGDFKYDAFVSYSVEDEKFVEKMVYILEKNCSRFNLCVFERDFQVGDVLTDRIVECMESSRRTILVLTESFAKSQWCCWEMYLAQSRSISVRESDPNDSLILIKKSEIPEALMTPTLRYLMSTRVYLEWHDSPTRQKLFWEQLKSSLRTGGKE